jgi:hypothetical protein
VNLKIEIDLEESEVIKGLLNRIETLEKKLLTSEMPLAIKASEVRKLFKGKSKDGAMSNEELDSIIRSGALTPFKLYEGARDNYFKTEDVLKLIPK